MRSILERRSRPDHALEELGGYLEQMVRLKALVTPRPHVVQHQNRADTAGQRPQRRVGTAKVERVQNTAE